MKKPIKKIARLSKYNWMIYARSYLKLADVGIKEIEKKCYMGRGLDPLFFYEEKWLLVPIVWNLKHAIELIVKTLNITVNKQYLMKHDLAMLSDDLKESLQKLKIKKPEKVEDLAIIIDKYYKCEFWDKKLIKEDTIFDIENDIFRYPESKMFLKSDIPQVLRDIPFNNEVVYSRETEEISEDIKKLGSLLGIISAQTERSKFNKKIKTH